MFPWGDAPTPGTPSYAVGDTIYSGDTPGRIVSVDATQGVMGVVWSDGDGGAITYPINATYLQKEFFPW